MVKKSKQEGLPQPSLASFYRPKDAANPQVTPAHGRPGDVENQRTSPAPEGESADERPSTVAPATPTIAQSPVDENAGPSDARRRVPVRGDWKGAAAEMVTELMRIDEDGWFMEAVDPERDGVPDYLEIIKEPMDLTTVQERLNKGAYSDPDAWARDVRLIFANAKQYNEMPDHAVHRAAQRLLDHFNYRFPKVFPPPKPASPVKAASAEGKRPRAASPKGRKRRHAATPPRKGGKAEEGEGSDDDDDDVVVLDMDSPPSAAGAARAQAQSTAEREAAAEKKALAPIFQKGGKKPAEDTKKGSGSKKPAAEEGKKGGGGKKAATAAEDGKKAPAPAAEAKKPGRKPKGAAQSKKKARAQEEEEEDDDDDEPQIMSPGVEVVEVVEVLKPTVKGPPPAPLTDEELLVANDFFLKAADKKRKAELLAAIKQRELEEKRAKERAERANQPPAEVHPFFCERQRSCGSGREDGSDGGSFASNWSLPAFPSTSHILQDDDDVVEMRQEAPLAVTWGSGVVEELRQTRPMDGLQGAMESEGVIDVEAEGQREEALQAVLKCPNPPQEEEQGLLPEVGTEKRTADEVVISLALEGGMDEPSARRLLRAARRQAHQHEDETAGVTVVGEGPISTSEGVQWVDKYRPRMPGLVCCAEGRFPGRQMSEWLKQWMARRKQHHEHHHSQGAEDSEDEYEDDGGGFGWTGDSDDEENPLARAMLLVGPTGSGKSSLVRACARQFNISVLEINTGQSRSGAEIKKNYGEAAQSQHIGGKQKGGAIKGSLLKGSGGAKGGRRGSKGQVKAAGQPADRRLSLMLFEEVDLVFEEDAGFPKAIRDLVQGAKWPIVLTANTMPQWLVGPRYNIVEMSRPAPPQLATLLAAIWAAEGLPALPPSCFLDLAVAKGGDVRGSLMTLQLWAAHPLVKHAKQTMHDNRSSDMVVIDDDDEEEEEEEEEVVEVEDDEDEPEVLDVHAPAQDGDGEVELSDEADLDGPLSVRPPPTAAAQEALQLESAPTLLGYRYPRVHSVWPRAGPIAGGTRVEIEGENFLQAAADGQGGYGLVEVFFGPHKAQEVYVEKGSSIHAVTPPFPDATYVEVVVSVRVARLFGSDAFRQTACQGVFRYGEKPRRLAPIFFPPLYISRVRGPGRGGKKGKKRRKKDDEGASEEGPAEGEEGEEKEEEEEEGEEEAVLVGDAPQDKATPENADKAASRKRRRVRRREESDEEEEADLDFGEDSLPDNPSAQDPPSAEGDDQPPQQAVEGEERPEGQGEGEGQGETEPPVDEAPVDEPDTPQKPDVEEGSPSTPLKDEEEVERQAPASISEPAKASESSSSTPSSDRSLAIEGEAGVAEGAKPIDHMDCDTQTEKQEKEEPTAVKEGGAQAEVCSAEEVEDLGAGGPEVEDMGRVIEVAPLPQEEKHFRVAYRRPWDEATGREGLESLQQVSQLCDAFSSAQALQSVLGRLDGDTDVLLPCRSLLPRHLDKDPECSPWPVCGCREEDVGSWVTGLALHQYSTVAQDEEGLCGLLRQEGPRLKALDGELQATTSAARKLYASLVPGAGGYGVLERDLLCDILPGLRSMALGDILQGQLNVGTRRSSRNKYRGHLEVQNGLEATQVEALAAHHLSAR